jgi:hypothetical protein
MYSLVSQLVISWLTDRLYVFPEHRAASGASWSLMGRWSLWEVYSLSVDGAIRRRIQGVLRNRINLPVLNMLVAILNHLFHLLVFLLVKMSIVWLLDYDLNPVASGDQFIIDLLLEQLQVWVWGSFWLWAIWWGLGGHHQGVFSQDRWFTLRLAYRRLLGKR